MPDTSKNILAWDEESRMLMAM